MIYLSLFLEFLKIGLFTFGGAYGAIPIIRETVLSNEWMSEEMFSNILAISESTPGPIMVNAATYIGNLQGGVPGAALATLGVVLPSFVVIILIAVFLKRHIDKPPVRAVLAGIKPCIAGIILATGIYMAHSAAMGKGESASVDWIFLLIFAVLAGVAVWFETVKKKQFSPIVMICISAGLGILLY